MRRRQNCVLVTWLLVLWLFPLLVQAQPETVPSSPSVAATVRPADSGAELINPGLGWVFHYYDNVPANYGSKLAPSDTLNNWPGLSVIRSIRSNSASEIER